METCSVASDASRYRQVMTRRVGGEMDSGGTPYHGHTTYTAHLFRTSDLI